MGTNLHSSRLMRSHHGAAMQWSRADWRVNERRRVMSKTGTVGGINVCRVCGNGSVPLFSNWSRKHHSAEQQPAWSEMIASAHFKHKTPNYRQESKMPECWAHREHTAALSWASCTAGKSIPASASLRVSRLLLSATCPRVITEKMCVTSYSWVHALLPPRPSSLCLRIQVTASAESLFPVFQLVWVLWGWEFYQ